MRNRSLPLFRNALLLWILAVSCFAQNNDKTIFLVRHAERASQATNSPLSPEGEKRAECLARMLGDAGIKAIFVSEFVRTQQTAGPLAKRLNVTPTVVKKDDIDGLVQKVRSSSAGDVLIVAHSDTLSKIVQKLGAGDIAVIGNTEYDRLLVVHTGGSNAATVTTLRYCQCEGMTPKTAIQEMKPER